MRFTLLTTSALTLITGVMSMPVTSSLTTRATSKIGACYGENRVLFTRYNIWIQNEKEYNLVCGDGCLANFRGRCGPGSVTDWGCDMGADGTGYYHFNVPLTCQSTDITAALNACLKQKWENYACTVTDHIAHEIAKAGLEIGVASIPDGKGPPKGGKK